MGWGRGWQGWDLEDHRAVQGVILTAQDICFLPVVHSSQNTLSQEMSLPLHSSCGKGGRTPLGGAAIERCHLHSERQGQDLASTRALTTHSWNLFWQHWPRKLTSALVLTASSLALVVSAGSPHTQLGCAGRSKVS